MRTGASSLRMERGVKGGCRSWAVSALPDGGSGHELERDTREKYSKGRLAGLGSLVDMSRDGAEEG